MGKALLDFGLQTAQGVIGAGMGMLLGKWNDKRQLEQQQALQGMEIRGQKEMTDYNMMKQMEMWKATNYKAQMEQLKQAGLNPGLIYGMGGSGGATTGQATGNVTGAHAPVGGGEPMAMATTAAQMGLMRAQKENIEADTENKKATTEKTAGVDTTKAQVETESISQGINNQKAAEILTRAQTAIAEAGAKIQGATVNEQIDGIVASTLRAQEELDQVARETVIKKATQNDVVDRIHAEAIGALLKNIMTKAETASIKTETQKKLTEIANNKITWKRLIQQITLATEGNTRENERIRIVKALADNAILGEDGINIGGLIMQMLDKLK